MSSIENYLREARELAGKEPAPPAKEFPLLAEKTGTNEVKAVSSRPQLARLSITHDAIMDWLLANPGKGQMGACAAHFGFTQAWLSSMVWSDAFQAKLADRKEELFNLNVVPIRDQMNGVVQRTLDRLGEKVEVVQDPKVLVDVADKLLHRLGYAPKVDQNPGVQNNTQNNFYAVSPELLAAAREKAKKGDLPNGQNALPAPVGLQNQSGDTMGEIDASSSAIPGEQETYEEEGS